MKARLISHIAVADAVCYISGTVITIWFISDLAPKLLGVDLSAEALKLEKELGFVRQAPGIVSGWRPFELRAFRIGPNSPLIGCTVAECEARAAGERMFAALREAGIGLFLGGIVVTTTPMIVGLFFGRYVLKMNPLLLLGGLAGAMTMTAAMAAVQVRSNSPVAVLGFTPAVPFGHILLTTWGTVIVGVIAG